MLTQYFLIAEISFSHQFFTAILNVLLLNLNSVVCWVGTRPDKLGYTTNKNIIAKDASKTFYHPIDGIVAEHEFIGLPHQCTVDLLKAFDPKEILSYF